MPAGPIGTVWAPGSWSDTAWLENTWADQGELVSGTASGASGPSIAVITGHVAHHGGVPRGTSPFERKRPTRAEPIDAMLALAQAGPRVTISGRIVLPNRGMVDIGPRRRFARGRGTVDDRPIVEDEAFLLGLLLGEDD